MANSLILTKAQNAITAHDWATAARLYKELLRSDESNVEYLKQLGSIYVRAGQDEKAIPYYEQIITFNPDNTDSMVSLGAIFRRLKRYEDSVNILHKAQDISSSNPNINYNLGFTYKEMGDYDDAIDAFESVINHNPDDVLAHNHLGSIYSAKKEYELAIAAFRRGLQVDQNHPILNYNLAHVYEATKNYPEAVRSYENALKTRPGWLDAIRDFSELLIRCQDTKQAQELVGQSIKLHPDDVDLLCILGRIYLNQFDYDNATKTFKKAETLKQHDINILVGLSKSLEKGMKIDQAMEKILDAVDIAPENLEVCKQYAHVLLSAQRYEKALDLIKTIDEKSDGKDLQILDLYGQYFICRGDEEAANTYFCKIKKINHHYKDYMINAADRYIQTGNYEKAEEMANHFVDSRPQLPEGYNLLGTINAVRGDLKKAKSDYEKGVSLKNPNIYAVKELEKIYNELETNKEIYNTDEMPIAVDADKLSEEEGGNLAEDGSLIDNDKKNDEQIDAMMSGSGDGEDELPDISSLESTPTIEQALTGEDGEFWEDFDDDPDAENKPAEEEEKPYDENEEDSDLMSMMTPAAGEEDSLKDGLSEDEGDFDFGDFEDGTIEDAVSEPVAESTPEAETEPASEYEPVGSSEQEPEYEPLAPKVPEKPEQKSDYEPDEPPVNTLSASDAQKMMNDLKNQQKELELQQREFALQQRELVNELKQENEKMIQETVEKAVEEAVEDKLSEYDLQPEQVAEEPVKEEAVIDEPSVEAKEERTEEEAEEEELDDSLLDEDLISSTESEDILAEEAALDGFDEALEDEEPVIYEPKTEGEIEAEVELEEPVIEESEVEIEPEVEVEPEVETEPEIELKPETEPEPEIEEEVESESEDSEISIDDADVTEADERDSDDFTFDQFLSVEELEDLCGGSYEEAAVEETVDEVPAAEKESDDNFITADDMLDKISRILNDDNMAKNYAAELELFKKLRVLSSFLPEKDKNSFECCRMRMVIEYIIQKMSGKRGLLITAESLIKSGVLGEEYNRQLEDCCEEELSNDLIRHVISDMKKLAQGLEDKYLCTALCVSADSILEQIALRNQKSEIF